MTLSHAQVVALHGIMREHDGADADLTPYFHGAYQYIISKDDEEQAVAQGVITAGGNVRAFVVETA